MSKKVRLDTTYNNKMLKKIDSMNDSYIQLLNETNLSKINTIDCVCGKAIRLVSVEVFIAHILSLDHSNYVESNFDESIISNFNEHMENLIFIICNYNRYHIHIKKNDNTFYSKFTQTYPNITRMRLSYLNKPQKNKLLYDYIPNM